MRAAALLVATLFLLTPAAAQELVWHAPEEAVAGRPLHMAYTMEDDDGLVGHVNVELDASLDGTSLLHLPPSALHEHDGFHGLVLTPPRAGTLTLHGAPGSGKAASTTVTVLPAPAEAERPEAALVTDGESAGFEAPDQDSWEHWALTEALDAEGRLRLATWQDLGHTMHLHREGAWRPQAVVTDAPDRPEDSGTTGAAFLVGDPNDPAVVHLPDPLVGLGGDLPPCSEAAPGFVLDPNAVGGTEPPTWQQHSTIRTAWPNHGHGELHITLFEETPAGALRNVLGATSVDPHGRFAFTVDAAGTYALRLSWPGDGGRCSAPFQVVPNPAPAGTLDAGLTPGPGSLHVAFTALDAQGGAIPHYEFDTRVVRLAAGDDAGALVWEGKLHGHGGSVEAELGGLPAGEYRVWTHPSPQNQDSPPLSATGYDGFVYTASVPPGPDSYHGGDDSEDSPGASVVAALAVLGAAFVAARRRV